MKNKIKVILDFMENPEVNVDAEQKVFLNGVSDPITEDNLIGKYITMVERDNITGCIVLTLEEEMLEIEDDK